MPVFGRSHLFLLLLAAYAWSSALGCSRILFNREGYPVLSARTMDWNWSFDDWLLVNPRGQDMDGGLGHQKDSKVWKSKYGSVVSSINGWLGSKVSGRTGKLFEFERDGVAEGMNEKGFAVHLLYLDEKFTRYPTQGASRSGLTYLRWARYLLDTCANVNEAVEAMKHVWIADVQISIVGEQKGASFGTHMAIEDSSGDSAIFELVDGSLQVYHGRSQNFSVMTNEPPLPQQLQNLKRYKAFGGEESDLPGDVISSDRFVRMTYYLRDIPKSQDTVAMAGYMRTIITNSAVPQGAPDSDDPAHGVYPTWWTSILDFKEMTFYWGWSLNPNFIWVDVRALAADGKLDEGRTTLLLNPRVKALVGDVTASFTPASGDRLSLPSVGLSLLATRLADAGQTSAVIMLLVAGVLIVLVGGVHRWVAKSTSRHVAFMYRESLI